MIFLRYKSLIRHFAMGVCALSALGAALAGCSDDLDLPTPDGPQAESGYITINLKSCALSTRAEEPGVDNLNENLIRSVTVCLSPSAGDRTDDKAPAFMQTFTGLNANGSATLRIPLTIELENRLFRENASNKCNIFAAVNVNPGEAKTVAELRALAISSTFDSQLTQASFTMDGDGTVDFDPAQRYATSEVTVKRSAAKFTLALAVDEEIQDGDVTWTPIKTGMSVMMQQGVLKSQLDPDPTPGMPEDYYFNSSSTLTGKYTFAFDQNATEYTTENGDKYTYNYVQSTPLYSYPNVWTGNDNEPHGTYLLLTVPWTADGGKTRRTCYYHVPVVPSGTYETVRNISYHINLHVGVLGSYVPDDPMEIEAQYYVADWGNEGLDVDIKDYRYLVVDQNEYTVNNENTYSIPFYTSHPTEVISSTMTYYRYNFSDQGSEFAVTVSEAQNNNANGEKVYTVDFDNTNKVLNISHDLDIYTPYNTSNKEVLLTRRANGSRADIDNKTEIQDMLKTISYYKKKTPVEAEYSAIKFEIKVQHTDVHNGETSYNKDTDYIETITVWQYPGMYITAVQNYCDNLASQTWTNAISGNTFINNNTDGDAYRFTQNQQLVTQVTGTQSNTNVIRLVYNYRNWDRSIGLGFPPNYFNWNPNLYLVTITQLSQELGEKYIIDDPRSYNINNDLSNNYGNYTVDGGSTNVFSNEYWVFSSGATGYYYRVFSQPYTSGTFTTGGKTYTVVNKYTINGFTTAPALGETQQRTLKYYYPTREANENKYTIAPKFRICSSYAGTSGYLTREMARRRAAAYQELGYPAGRWRLPTFGEVEYIMTLAAQQKIPRLFGTSSAGTWYYWCAQGAVSVPDANHSTQPIEIVENLDRGGTPFYTMPFAPYSGDNYLARTRFVYDEWYWGSETLDQTVKGDPNSTRTIYTFTWGDKEKSNPEQK